MQRIFVRDANSVMIAATKPIPSATAKRLNWDLLMALVKENFARNLTSLLERFERRPIELARHCEVNPSTVNGWMTGRVEPKLSRLDQIASFFGPGVTYMDLLRDPAESSSRGIVRSQEDIARDLESISREFLLSRGYEFRSKKP